jgi:hypothetical protein
VRKRTGVLHGYFIPNFRRIAARESGS